MSKYHVSTQSGVETFSTARVAISYAKAIAPIKIDKQCLVWDRPFHAIANVRHYPDTGETLVHRYDRYGREQPGTED